ncbi:hypothetical protein QBC46DRAFT_412472 [Diplogelasinospora grovesii]|uniref:Uncharacterized protein n=1 Tax=Diplogelasinospora grovesii TaxID=303347 RepID=A0AAN6MZX4_9PEZI|nr:hypothetical protein QBC46DRAFT_412472 [Diplogelasinospora grovesii]
MSIKSILSLAVMVTAAAAGAIQARCNPNPPAIKDANTVTLALYGDSGCCDAPFQTISLGVVGTCHTINAPGLGWEQAVGQNMFGQGIKIWTFTDTNCQSNGKFIDLHNSNTCDFRGEQFQSIKLATA